jgi:dTDP-4-amino-4,6-dideoxygalactose transaminase
MTKILAAGEGGMVTTNDGGMHRRALMYHDSAVCPHEGVPLEEWLPGVNLRMSELHAAVAQVQLRRVDSMLETMRAHKARLKRLISDDLLSQGVTFRTIHDVAGEASIALIFFVPDRSRTSRVVAALTDENIPASCLYQELKYLPHDHIDLHVYTSWLPILRQQPWSAHGGPWRGHPRKIEYSAGMCPRTLDLVRRAVHVDISPELTPIQVEQMAGGILKVARATL